jgi:hypothetical protein
VTKHQEELKRARQRRRTSGAKLGDMDARGNLKKIMVLKIRPQVEEMLG